MFLIESTKCNILLASGPLMPIAAEIHTEKPDSRLLPVPELDEWFNDVEAELYPFTKTFEEAKDDPVCIFHTSGTTSGQYPDNPIVKYV
jgi:acyl-coenzyme A synthetase/AMP-(fatty) acid ligase